MTPEYDWSVKSCSTKAKDMFTGCHESMYFSLSQCIESEGSEIK